jgi:hypothetical protein
MATRQIFSNISCAGVSATTDPVINRLDCSHGTLFPDLRRENVIRAAIPVTENVNPMI